MNKASVLEQLNSAADVEHLRVELSKLSSEVLVEISESSFRYVIGSNFTGALDVPAGPSCLTDEICRDLLSFGVNAPYFGMRNIVHLALAKLITVDLQEKLKDIPSSNLLSFRVLLLWQLALPEPSAEIQALITSTLSNYENWTLSDREWAQFYLERANSHLHYFEYENCSQCIQKALKYSGVSVELAGKMGKRTRFQEKSLAQLILNTTTNLNTEIEEDSTDIPTNVKLQDDTLLETVVLAVGEEKKILSSIQSAAIMALFQSERRTQHNDELLYEQCRAYLDEVINQRKGWSVQLAALLARSTLEKKKNRTIERACMQSEYIVKVMSGIDDPTPSEIKAKRVDLVLASGLPPFWKAAIVHAEILVSLGCVSEALLLYERMQLWDNVIDCFKALGQLEKAETLIRRLIEERPKDSMLYVNLGDITQEPKYYEQAMEVSSDRNSRARKAIGLLMLSRNRYQEAYEHLRRSLELQPLQLGVWFNAGYCAWKLSNYVDASTCYHRCVSLEPEHFEAWNNLSAAYIRQGQKDRARRIIQEALKFNYEHYNVWENYLLLCVDTGEWMQAVHAYHRLLDLKKRQLQDEEVLELMLTQIVKVVLTEHEDPEQKAEVAKLKSEATRLMARCAAVQSLTSKMWKLYATLKKPEDDNPDDFEKYLSLLERSLLVTTNRPNWVKTDAECVGALESALHLGMERMKLAKILGTEAASKEASSRIRMSLRTLLATAKREYGDRGSAAVKEIMSQVDSFMTTVAQ